MSPMKRLAITLWITSSLLAAGHALAAEVTIKRDDYGTPHIYAEDTYGLFYGYGYAIAQDRLFQMEMAKRSVLGRVAEVLGADHIEFDKKTRASCEPAAIKAQLAALRAKDRAIFDGYAAGMNAWMAKVRAQPDKLMPKQFIDYGFDPEDWSDFDVAMIFVGSMGNQFGDFNTELENQQLLDALVKAHGEKGGWALFNQLNPTYDPQAPTTVPSKTASQTRWQPVNSSPRNLYIAAATSTEVAGTAAFNGFSNMIMVGRDKAKDASAILLNGPQFGWYAPAYTYSVGLHGAGFDLVGNTPFGYPAVMFGYNADISWGSTWGAADVVDIYRETLNPDNPREYLFNDESIPWSAESRRSTSKAANPSNGKF